MGAVRLVRGGAFDQPDVAVRPADGSARRVAVYTGEASAPDAPLAVYDIYTRLLPENDLLHLQKGIPVYSDAELQTLLEDFGL